MSIPLALMCIAAKALWCVGWIIVALYAVEQWAQSQNLNSNLQSSYESISLLVAALLLSFHWTSQVLKNIVHVTSAGAFAQWYFHAGVTTPTWDAFKRCVVPALL